MQQPLLAFNNVEISYDDEAMIQGVSLKMNKGEILGIVGESGSGKSTLIKASMGLLGRSGRVSQGEILYQGQNVLNLGDEAFRIAGVHSAQSEPLVTSFAKP